MNHKGFIPDRSLDGFIRRQLKRQISAQGWAEIKKYRIRVANERNRLDRMAQMSRGMS